MKYVAVRDHLADLIDTQLSAGDAIPSERDLADQFGVSRMTVRRAIDSLVADAVLARRQGSGTYVAQPKMDVQARMTSFTEEMRQRGMIPGSRLIRAEQLLATPDVAAWLGISIHDRVHFVHRVRLADGVPMAVEKTWVAVDSAPHSFHTGSPRACTRPWPMLAWCRPGVRTPSSPPLPTRRSRVCCTSRQVPHCWRSPGAPTPMTEQCRTPGRGIAATVTSCGSRSPVRDEPSTHLVDKEERDDKTRAGPCRHRWHGQCHLH